MTDVVDAATRSRMMSGIRGANTKPELLVRSGLHRLGIRYSLENKALPGNPDLVLSRHRTVLFVNGCFWHAHKCKDFKLPSTNREFWSEKLTGNVERDIRQVATLQSLGWKVVVIWECATKVKASGSIIPACRIAHDWLTNYDDPYLEIFRDEQNGVSKRQSTSRAL